LLGFLVILLDFFKRDPYLMGATEKQTTNLPLVNGDIIFGTFMVLWTALMVQQSIKPWPMFAFERWLYDGVGLPSPGPEWTAANYWVPGVATFLYFAMLLHMPKFMEERERPKWLKKVVFVWNIFLSVGSSWAAVRIVGQVAYVFKIPFTPVVDAESAGTHPFYELICDKHSVQTCQNALPMPCMYLMLFCLSKIPEMLDTLWLILGKKKVIFLHWFHHTSVMWFCWLAWTYTVSMGTFFALMNLSVHSLMYAWYALTAADKWLAVGLKPKKLFSQTVTVLQILQMVLGFSLTLYVHLDKECGNPRVVTRYALGMYGVYLVLFVHFFNRRYCRKKKPLVKRPPFGEDRFFEECCRTKAMGVDKRPAGGARKRSTRKRKE